jgi:hypothetical protein
VDGLTMSTPMRETQLNRADYSASGLLVAASILCALPLFRGQQIPSAPRSFSWICAVVALVFFGALSAIWMDPVGRRKGVVRGLSLVGSAALMGAGLAFTSKIPTYAFFSNWLPAVLALLAALVLQGAHRQLVGPVERVTLRQRFARRP